MRQTAKPYETKKSTTGHISNLHDDIVNKNYLLKFRPENYVSQLQKPNNLFLCFP